MAMQEFLASFAVDIDESGVNRLQSILKDNKSLADALASAFQAAKTALQEYAAEAANTDLPFADLFSRQGDAATDALSNAVSSFTGEVILPVSLDLTKANQALRAFKNSDATKLRLTGDASAVVAAANTALASIKAAYSGTTLSLGAKIEPPAGPSAGAGTAAGNVGTAASGTVGPATPAGSSAAGSGLLRSSSGGRFTRSTATEVAEDGQTEYIIPIQKESIAVPLIRQMLGELSSSAKESLTPSFSALSANLGTLAAPAESPAPAASVQAPVNITVNPDQKESIAVPLIRQMLGELSSSAKESLTPSFSALSANLGSLSAPAASPAPAANVQAPVNITVNPAAAQPEAVARSVYNLAERYLVKTLKGAAP